MATIIHKLKSSQETADILEDITRDEFNIPYEEYILPKYDNESHNDSSPIPIDKLQEILNELKKNGCNTVSIDYHIDHDTYLIDGFKTTKE